MALSDDEDSEHPSDVQDQDGHGADEEVGGQAREQDGYQEYHPDEESEDDDDDDVDTSAPNQGKVLRFKKPKTTKVQRQAAMVKGAHRSRRKQKNTHYGLVSDGDIAIIAPRLGDPNQQVTGNIRDGGVGQRFYNRWKKSKNLLSHCFFDLKGLPGSLDQTDYHDTSYLLEEKKKYSTAHLQSLRPLVTVDTAAGTFQASCLSIVIVILSLDVLERFRHKNRKSQEVTAYPMTPKVVLIADDSLHTSLTTDYESTLRVIGHNFGFVVLGTSKYFRSQPYLQYVGVHGHAGGRTFLDSWYSIFGGEL